MPFYSHHVYPHLVRVLGNPEPFRKVREKLIPWGQGTVLEIGVGPGVNFGYYDPAKVTKVYALEPNPGMIRLADAERQRTALEVEFLEFPGERIPLDDRSVDTVVSTFTFCSIPNVVVAMAGIRRVLRPGGRVIFFEHGLSPHRRVQRWQKCLEPITRCVFHGCHITRETPNLLTQAGFDIEQMESGYLAPFPKSLTYCWWGTACQRT